MGIAKTIASALIDLINAQPRSPRLDEIEAVVAKHVPAQSDLPPMTFCWEEFHALIKARGRIFLLDRREPQSADTIVVWSDPVAVFFDRNMARSANGLLNPAHRIYVVGYDEEMDCWQMYTAESGTIEVLLPGHLRPIWQARNKAMGW